MNYQLTGIYTKDRFKARKISGKKGKNSGGNNGNNLIVFHFFNAPNCQTIGTLA